MVKHSLPKPKSPTPSSNILNVLSTYKPKLTTRIVLLLFNTTADSSIIQTALLVIEYAQLISLMILLYPDIESDQYVKSNLLFQGIIFAAKFINLGYLLNFTGNDRVIQIVLVLTAIIMLLKYVHYLRLVIMTAYNLKIADWNVRLWKLNFNIQSRLVFSMFTSIWFSVIQAAEKSGFRPLQLDFVEIIVISTVMITLEYIFSLHLCLTYCYVLPSKVYLSSKNNQLQVLTLTHKIALQVIIVLLTSFPYRGWVTITLNMCFCCLQYTYFLRVLPLYKITALLWQGGLLACATSLALAQLVQETALTVSGESNAGALFVWWMLLSLLSTIATTSYLKRLLIYLATDARSNKSVELSVHRISLIMEMRGSDGYSLDLYTNCSLQQLEWQAVNKCVFNMTEAPLRDLDQKVVETQLEEPHYQRELMDRWSLHFLENLYANHPKSGLVKVYLIYFYLKKFRLYWQAAKIIKDLKGTGGRSTLMTASILEAQAWSVRQTETEDGNSIVLGVSTFVEHQDMLEQLKRDILHQAQQQIMLYQELTDGYKDLNRLLQYGISITTCQARIKKRMRLFSEQSSESFLEPYLLFAEYHLILNYCLSGHAVCRKHYNHNWRKYDKHFNQTELSSYNLYHELNAFIIVSGQKSDSGNIVFCNRAMTNMFGGDAQQYIGKSASSLALARLQPFYAKMLRDIIERNDKSSLNNIKYFYGVDREGYLIKAEMVANIHPNLSQGLFLIVVLRPSLREDEMLIVDESGHIETSTKKLAQDLNLGSPNLCTNKASYNIKSLSKYLEKANEAFFVATSQPIRDEKIHSTNPAISLITSPKEVKNTMMSPNNANKICASFFPDGQCINLIPFSHDKRLSENRSHSITKGDNYHCNISTLSFFPVSLRLFVLRKLDLYDAKESYTAEQQNRLRVKFPSYSRSKKLLNGTADHLRTENDDLQRLSSGYNIELKPSLPTVEDKQPRYDLDIQSCNQQSLDGNLLSPPSSQRLMLPSTARESAIFTQNGEVLTTQGALMTPRHQQFLNIVGNPVQNSFTTNKKMQEVSSSGFHRLNKLVSLKNKLENPVKGQPSESFGRVSRRSQKMKISSAFKAALNVKFQSDNLRFSTYIFVMIMMLIVITQLILKAGFDSNFTSLGVESDIVTESQYRTHLLLNLASEVRITYDKLQGYINQTDLGRLSLPISQQNAFFIFWTQSLSQYNQKLITSTFSLDQKSRTRLFQADVNMYDTNYNDPVQTYTTLNNFAATNDIVERSLSIFHQAAAGILVTDDYIWLLRNCVNDLLIKYEEVATVFFNTLQSHKTEILLKSQICSAMIFAILLILFIGISTTINKVYLDEKRNLTAITKLDTRYLCARVSTFKSRLEFGEQFRDEPNGHQKDFVRASGTREEDNRHLKRLNTPSESTTWTIRNKYLLYILKLSLFFIIIALLALWQLLTIRGTITTLSAYQNQLYYINQIRIRLTLSNMASIELLSADSVKTIENMALPEKVDELDDDVAAIGDSILKILSGSYGRHQEVINQILYEDICAAVLDYGFIATLTCDIALQMPTDRGYIRVLSIYQSYLADRNNRYIASDKSFSSLKTIKTDQYDVYETQFYILMLGTTKISDCLDSILDNHLSRTLSTMSLLMIFLFVAVAIMSLATWVFVLRPVKNSDAQIKQLLQAFPPELVLKNHLLRIYLQNTSKGALDCINSDIQ